MYQFDTITVTMVFFKPKSSQMPAKKHIKHSRLVVSVLSIKMQRQSEQFKRLCTWHVLS